MSVATAGQIGCRGNTVFLDVTPVFALSKVQVIGGLRNDLISMWIEMGPIHSLISRTGNDVE